MESDSCLLPNLCVPSQLSRTFLCTSSRNAAHIAIHPRNLKGRYFLSPECPLPTFFILTPPTSPQLLMFPKFSDLPQSVSPTAAFHCLPQSVPHTKCWFTFSVLPPGTTGHHRERKLNTQIRSTGSFSAVYHSHNILGPLSLLQNACKTYVTRRLHLDTD